MEKILPDRMTVIAIQNYGPSGTLFLHSLLDNHPQVIQLPGLSGIHILKRIEEKFSDEPMAVSTLAGIFLSSYSCLYEPNDVEYSNGLNFLGENCNEHPCVDAKAFSANFIDYLEYLIMQAQLPAQIHPGQENKYLKVFFHAIYAAYSKGLGKEPAEQTFLVYPIHSGHPDQALRLQEMFDECVFIHMVRNPLDMLDSSIKYLEHTRKYDKITLNIFDCALTQIFEDHAPQVNFFHSMHSIYPYPRLESHDKVTEFSIQFEKLHTQPENTLKTICQQINLPWSDTLLESSFAGKQWWNRPSLRQMSGFNRDMKPKTKFQHYSSFDAWRLSVISRPLLKGLGYISKKNSLFSKIEILLARFMCMLPFRIERTSIDTIRSIIVAHKARAEAGSKQSKDLTAVAYAYWDARRRKSLFRLITTDIEEESKPGNQRTILVYRDNEDNVRSTELDNFDAEAHRFASGVLQDSDDALIPKLTSWEKAKCALLVYLKEYIENRKKLWNAYKQVSRRQDEIIYPLMGPPDDS